MFRRLSALLFLLGMAGAALAVAAPDPRGLLDAGRRPQEWVGLHGADQAVLTVAAATAWLTLAWLSVGVVLTVAGELPGFAGRAGRAVAVLVVPTVLRRSLALTLGAGIALGGPSAAWSAPAPAPATVLLTVTAVSAQEGRGDPNRLDWPVQAAAPGTDRAPAPPARDTVLVQRGDSLWRIVEERLGPQARNAEIAAAVSAWYHANAQVIGDDPDLIRPGQELRPPTGAGAP